MKQGFGLTPTLLILTADWLIRETSVEAYIGPLEHHVVLEDLSFADSCKHARKKQIS